MDPSGEWMEVARLVKRRLTNYDGPEPTFEEVVARFGQMVAEETRRGLIGAEGGTLDAEQRTATDAEIIARLLARLREKIT